VDQLQPAELERLQAGVGEVDDRESKVPERHTLVEERAAPVRPAMREPVQHALDGLPLGRPSWRDDAAEPAHG